MYRCSVPSDGTIASLHTILMVQVQAGPGPGAGHAMPRDATHARALCHAAAGAGTRPRARRRRRGLCGRCCGWSLPHCRRPRWQAPPPGVLPPLPPPRRPPTSTSPPRAWRSRCLSAPARCCRCARQRRQERAAWAMATAGRSSVGRARRAAQPPVRGIARARQKAGERTTAPARARRTQVALCRGGTSLALPLAPPSLPAVVRAENDVDAGLSRAPTKRSQSPSGRTCARCASASCAPTSLPRC